MAADLVFAVDRERIDEQAHSAQAPHVMQPLFGPEPPEMPKPPPATEPKTSKDADAPTSATGVALGILIFVNVLVMLLCIVTMGNLGEMRTAITAIDAKVDAVDTKMSGITSVNQTCKDGFKRIEKDINTPHIPIPGMNVGQGEKIKIILAQDVDWPPYAFFASPPDGKFELAGFGNDVAHGLPTVCPHLEITTVQTKWDKCWDSGAIGVGLLDGHYHGCMTYTHTAGQRNRFLEFSNGLLKENKPAGLLVRLNPTTGKPLVSPQDNLSGKTVVDVVGWAPTADTFGIDENKCTKARFEGYTMKTPEELGVTLTGNANDDAMKALREGKADAIWYILFSLHPPAT